MARLTCALTIRFAWWVMPYVYGVQLFSDLTGMEPDYDKVVATVFRGISIR